MPTIKANEREFMGQVVSWLNEAISQGTYPFEITSHEHRLKTYSPMLPVTEANVLWVIPKQKLMKARSREILHDCSA